MQPHEVVDSFRKANRRGAGGERKALWCARRCIPLAPRGIDAPTPARTVGLPPRRGTYFLSKRKKVPKKARGTATTGKRLLLPILTAGLFPSAAYRRSAPPQLAQGIISPCGVGCFGVACVFLQGKMPARNQIHAGIFCEPEGLSPDGGLIYSTNRKPHQTGEPRGLSPSGGKTPANLLSLQYPRAL